MSMEKEIDYPSRIFANDMKGAISDDEKNNNEMMWVFCFCYTNNVDGMLA